MSDKQRWPIADALRAAQELCEMLDPVCERLIIAGSIRRKRPDVGDIELVYVPKFCIAPDISDLFSTKTHNMADTVIAGMEKARTLSRRVNVLGKTAFGEKIKLMVHPESGIPVDLFATTIESWWNYLVCRTGPADSNTRICVAAQQRGWKWAPYSPGFTRYVTGEDGEIETRAMDSEQAVFEFVGLPYFEPEDRK